MRVQKLSGIKEVIKTITLSALIAAIPAFIGGFYTATQMQSGIRAELVEQLQSASKPAEAANQGN